TNKHQHNDQHSLVVIDEIQNFVEARWISAPKAIYLRDQQRINFNENIPLERFIEADQNQQTTLTKYFKMNAQDPDV
ncbi:5640_t:CDS:2, partial [Racocetra fulgida]